MWLKADIRVTSSSKKLRGFLLNSPTPPKHARKCAWIVGPVTFYLFSQPSSFREMQQGGVIISMRVRNQPV